MSHHTTHVNRKAILRLMAILGMVLGMFAPLAQPASAAPQYNAFGWGYNNNDQLGDGMTTNQYTPVQVQVPDIAAIAAGYSHTLALKKDGTVWSWGYNLYGQLGNGTYDNTKFHSPAQVPGLNNVKAVAAGGYHSLALTNDGTVWFWGMIRDETGYLLYVLRPIQVDGLTDIVAIAAGGYHSLALRQDGTLFAWGSNQYAQLGYVPHEYINNILVINSPVVGDSTASGICTKPNNMGSYPCRIIPEQVGTNVTAMAAGTLHSLAVKSDGTVWSWGYNHLGQLGNGTTSNDPTPPVQVSNLSDMTTVAAGGNHSLALKNDGTVWAWGSNSTAQLGDGTTNTFRTTPVQTSGLSNVRALAAGNSHSMALKSDGTVWTWGNNASGQRGYATIINYYTPQQVTAVSGVTSISANLDQSFAVLPLTTDTTPPTITGSRTPAANSFGWNNGPVVAHFACVDAESGIASCEPDHTFASEGAGQSYTGTATDNAGNSATATVADVNIDMTAPAITLDGITDGSTYTLGAVPADTCTATDALSGLDGTCSVSVSGGNANGVGTFSFTATATDKAGNTATATGSYRVIYRFDGFLQPINDTNHPDVCGANCVTSMFKTGSTVAVKFQLKTADGTIIQAGSLPQWLTPQRGRPTIDPIDEDVYSDPATSGATFRWDSTAQQYIYTWSTKGASSGYYYRISVLLDDGQTYSVDIGLR